MVREKLRTQIWNMQHNQKQYRAEGTTSSSTDQQRPPLQFSQSETKLLYTLHWILLDAAAECEDAEAENAPKKPPLAKNQKNRFLHDLASLQLFVYLFAPLVEHLRAEDFGTLKLETGLSIWVPLMAHLQPVANTLTNTVKLFDLDNCFYDSFGSISALTDTSKDRHVADSIRSIQQPFGLGSASENKVGGIYVGEARKPTQKARAIRISDSVPHIEATSGESDDIEPTSSMRSKPQSLLANTDSTTKLKSSPLRETTDSIDDDNKSPSKSTNQDDNDEEDLIGYARIQRMLTNETKNIIETLELPNGMDSIPLPHGPVNLLATHYDLAVLRCLYCGEWTEAGIHWALKYLFKRLLQMRLEWNSIQEQTRQQLRLSGSDKLRWSRETNDGVDGKTIGGDTSNLIILQGVCSQSMPDLTCPPVRNRIVKEPGKKSGSTDDRVDHSSTDHDSSMIGPPDRRKGRGYRASLKPELYSDTTLSMEAKHSSDKSGLQVVRNAEAFVGDTSLSLALPLVTLGGSRLAGGLSAGNQPSWKASKRSRIADIKERFTRASKLKSGEHGPNYRSGESTELDTVPTKDSIEASVRLEVPSRGLLSSGRSQQSLDAELGESGDGDATRKLTVGRGTGKESPESPNKVCWSLESDEQTEARACLVRSETDSEIVYHTTEKVEVVPGAMHCISSNGQLHYCTLLRALYWCSTVPMSPRICAESLRCLSTLFDSGIFSNRMNRPKTPHFKARKPINFQKLGVKLREASKTFGKYEGSAARAAFKSEDRTNRSHFYMPGRKPKSPTSRRCSAVIYIESEGSRDKDDLSQKKEFSSNKRSDERLASFTLGDSPRHSGRTADHTYQSAVSPSAVRRFQYNFDSFSSSKSNSNRPMSNIMSDRKRRYATTNKPTSLALKPLFVSKQVMKTNRGLAIEIVMRCIRSVGCPYGHHSWSTFGPRDALSEASSRDKACTREADEARRLSQDCLVHLYNSNKAWFTRVLSRIVTTMCVSDLMDLYHSVTGFCLPPAARRLSHATGQANTDSKSYANSFGQSSLESGGARAAESIIIASSLGPFIRRLVRCRTDLLSQENMSLFGDVRQFFAYLREVHGSAFRRHMLVAMMCPIRRCCERTQQRMPTNWSRMSTRNSTWLLPRQEKRRSSSLFSEGLIDPETMSGTGIRGQLRFTSWHTLLPRASVVSRGLRSTSASITAAGALLERTSDTSHTRPESEWNSSQQVIEHRWVNTPALKEGLLDFAFLMECVDTGTLPEPQLVAALLDLDAPVVARACLLLECAALVHRCNRGEWAGWMKFNLPSSFQPTTATSTTNNTSRTSPGSGGGGMTGPGGNIADGMWTDAMVIKRNAGRLFHAWAEALGTRLKYFITTMNLSTNRTTRTTTTTATTTATGTTTTSPTTSTTTTAASDGADANNNRPRESNSRHFSALETEENFLDDASVNPTGDSCPYALLSVAVQLLLEITTYLRETHPRLPTTRVKDFSTSSPYEHSPAGHSASVITDSSVSSGKTTPKRPLSREASHEGPKHSTSSSTGTSFRAARRRLSILMPIFGSGTSVNNEDADTDESVALPPDHPLPGRRNLSSRRISFAVFTETKSRRNSLLGSATSLDHSPDSDKPMVSKSLLRHSRGSGSFKRPPIAKHDTGSGIQSSMRERSESSGLPIQLPPEILDHSPSQLSDESKLDEHSDTETARGTASMPISRTSTMGLKLPKSKPHAGSSHGRVSDEMTKAHGTVRRSVSAAVAFRRQRTPSMHPPSNSSVIDQELGEQDACSTQLTWIDSVIEFLNCTNFNCDHQSHCQSNCFERQQHQCRALMSAVTQVYGADIERSFLKSIDRQSHARPTETSNRSNTRMTTSHARGSPVPRSPGSRERSSGSEAGSSPNASDTDADSLKRDTNRVKRLDPKRSVHHVPSHDSLTGLSKTSDSEMELTNWLSQRAGSNMPTEGRKTKGSMFSKSAKRKESQFFNLGGRKDSTPFLEKLRIRSANRLAPPDTDSPGLTSLLSLGVLAGAGAGMLRNSSSSVGLFGSVDPDEDDMQESDWKKPHGAYRRMNKIELPIQRYINNQVKNLCSNTFNLLLKAALLLTNQQLTKVVPIAWELLLEPEEELTSSSACLILFCGVRSSTLIQDLLLSELQHESSSQRLNAILRFRALWTHRYHVWSRLDEGAPGILRLPPPFIEFVLPSPTLGYAGYEAPDPAWQIRKGTSAEEVQLKQNEATKTFVTASTSRRKQQQELLVRALAAETVRRRDARRQFHLMTCPLLERAAIEPAFTKEHRDEVLSEEGLTPNLSVSGTGVSAPSSTVTTSVSSTAMQDEFNAAVRRLSVAPINRTMLNQSRNSSWRQGSISWFRSGALAHDEDDRGLGYPCSMFHAAPLQQAQYIFPSALCAAAVPLIQLLDDASVNDQGIAVNTIAEFCVFQCLLEDTALFLRFLLERITRIKQKDELIFVLRKMIQRLPELPMQSAHAIFNNLVGYITFHVRSPSFGAPEAIASALSVLHLVVPHVQNIYFKDMKQTMRREQIDSTLLLTANLPCAKQFNVFDNDIGVAQLVRLQDENRDYQFEDILRDALEASGVPVEHFRSYFLCDDRSNIIRNTSHYIRDYYPFKRNHTPKLRLHKMGEEHGWDLLQQNALNAKFQELCKVLFTTSVLQCSPSAQMSNHVFFLHEELTKLPSFPRKALETEFSLYSLDFLGRQLLGLDTVHKLTWCQLLSNLFTQMPSTYPWTADLQLFLNVYNGTLILHAEDSSVLRQCLAFYIQCCYQFKTAFSTSGYAGILPTLMRVYNQHMHNAVLTQAVEFTCRQFYVMHRTPFVLQLFGSLANYVAIGDEPVGLEDEFYRIQPVTLYRILRMINRPLPDNLRILEVCRNVNKPLKALDFCYEEDEANWSVVESINLCIAVIVYAPDSYRARQMLVILQGILPFILRDLPAICAEENFNNEPKKAELLAIQKISIAMRQLISTTEFMTRRVEETRTLSIHAPGGPGERRTGHLGAGLTHHWAHSSLRGGNSETMTDGRTKQRAVTTKANEPTASQAGSGHTGNNQPASTGRAICEPRESILLLACEFLSACSARLTEIGERQRIPDLLDSKSHLRLSEMIQSVIKQVPANPELLSLRAVQRYFLEILPLVEWGHESMRSCKALETLLGRLNRTLPKLLEHSATRSRLYWDDLVKLIHSIYLIIRKNRTIAHLKEIRVLVETLKKSVIFDPSGCLPALIRSRGESTSPNVLWSSNTGNQSRQTDAGEVLVGTNKSTDNCSNLIHPGSGRCSTKSRPPGTANERATHSNSHAASSAAPSKVAHATCGHMRNAHIPSYSFRFAAEVIRLISLVLQVMGNSFCLKDLCERSGPDYNIRCPSLLEGGFPTLAIYLGQLIVPLLFRSCAGRKDSPTLSKENVFYALDVCLTALFAPITNTTTSSTSKSLRTPSGFSFMPEALGQMGTSVISSDRSRERSRKHAGGPELHLSETVSSSPVTLDFAAGQQPILKLISLASLTSDQEGCLTRLLSPTLGSATTSQNSTSTTTTASTLAAPASLQPNSVTLKPSGKSDGTGEAGSKLRVSITSGGGSKSRTQYSNSHLRNSDNTGAHPHTSRDRPKNFKAEFGHRLGFLGLKLILVAYSRHASVRLRLIAATLTQLALNSPNGIQLWKFFDFLVTHRPPVFVHLLPFIRFKMARLECATPGEQAYQQIVNQKLIGLHLPVPQTTAAVLRDLMAELNAIQHDVQHFCRAQIKDMRSVKPSTTHASVRRLQSSELTQAASLRKQPSKKTRPVLLANLPEDDVDQNESDLDVPGPVEDDDRIDVLASVTSDSACSNDVPEAIEIGLPSLSRYARGTRSMLHGFRQSFSQRDPRKRIGAQEGSRMLTQNQNPCQTDPILTASAESLLRQSQPSTRKKNHMSVTATSTTTATTTGARVARGNNLTGAKLAELVLGRLDSETTDSESGDEIKSSVGPAAAAAIATSLYGSGAPYLHAREKARQELASLVGIGPATMGTTNDHVTTSLLTDFVFADQDEDTTTTTKQIDSATGSGLAKNNMNKKNPHQTEIDPKGPTQRASKIDYV